jgi:hypothetical protein
VDDEQSCRWLKFGDKGEAENKVVVAQYQAVSTKYLKILF